MLHGNHLSLGLQSGDGRYTKQLLPVLHIVHHSGARGDGHLVSDFYMTGNPDLPADDHIIPQLTAARDTHLRHDDGVFADGDVVADLHQVIHLRTAPDDGRSECSTVNRHTRAEFDVVADDDIADLGNFAVNALVEHVTKTIRTHH